MEWFILPACPSQDPGLQEYGRVGDKKCLQDMLSGKEKAEVADRYFFLLKIPETP